jgi:hypothetical protein
MAKVVQLMKLDKPSRFTAMSNMFSGIKLEAALSRSSKLKRPTGRLQLTRVLQSAVALLDLQLRATHLGHPAHMHLSPIREQHFAGFV